MHLWLSHQGSVGEETAKGRLSLPPPCFLLTAWDLGGHPCLKLQDPAVAIPSEPSPCR